MSQKDSLVMLISEVDKLALDIEGFSKDDWDLYEFETVKIDLEDTEILNYLKESRLNAVDDERDTVNVSDLIKEFAELNQEIDITLNHEEYGSVRYSTN